MSNNDHTASTQVQEWIEKNSREDGELTVDTQGMNAEEIEAQLLSVMKSAQGPSHEDLNALAEAHPDESAFQKALLIGVLEAEHIEQQVRQFDEDMFSEEYARTPENAASFDANAAHVEKAWSVRDLGNKYGAFDLDKFEHEFTTRQSRELVEQAMADEKRKANSGRVVRKKLSEYKPVAPAFLWEDMIALRGLSVVTGEGGQGKSTGLRKLASDLTRGELPGQFFGKPVGVLYVAGEEDVSGSVLASFQQAGADTDRVHIWAKEDEYGNESTKNLDVETDMEVMKEWCLDEDIRLVVVDPITQFFGDAEINAQNEAREALMPWTKLAEEINGAVVGIAHTNKSRSGDMSQDVSGSAAITQVARSVIGFAMDELGGVLSVVKSNVGPKKSFEYALRFDEVEMPNEWDDQVTVQVPVFALGAQTSVTAGEVQTGQRMKDSGKAEKAAITNYAAEGSQLAKELYDHAFNHLGLLDVTEEQLDGWPDSEDFKRKHAKTLFPGRTKFVDWIAATGDGKRGKQSCRNEVLPWLIDHGYVAEEQTGKDRYAVIPLLSRDVIGWTPTASE